MLILLDGPFYSNSQESCPCFVVRREVERGENYQEKTRDEERDMKHETSRCGETVYIASILPSGHHKLSRTRVLWLGG